MRDLKEQPFEEVAVDLIGPWKFQVRGKPYELNALTAIDTVTNLVEIVLIDKKTSEHITARFAQSWMARYPWPKRCVHDNGGEFVGWEFQQFLDKCNVKDVPTTSRNPQANSICERMHQSVGNILRTLLHGDPPENVSKANDMVDEALSIAQHAMRTSVHTTLGSSPGALVFSRDMFLNVPLSSDWHAITQKREHLINYRLMRQNAQRRTYDYAPNQKVLKKVHDPTKLGIRTTGPYKIKKTHVNGTVTMELRAGVSERINIRRVIPYRENND